MKKTPSGRGHTLKSVYFWPDTAGALFSGPGSGIHAELDAVLGLVDFADSYVLNDTTAVAGATWDIPGPVCDFLWDEASRSDAVATIGYGPKYDFDMIPIDAALNIPRVEEELRQIGRRTPKWEKLADKANLLQAKAYIMLADRESGTYIPERLYGLRAIETYGDIVAATPHTTFNTVRARLVNELRVTGEEPAWRLTTPCLLAEALRNARTPNGIFQALRDLRSSYAAKNYRLLLRTATDTNQPQTDRRSALRELIENSSAAFNREGLRSGIPKWFKWSVLLSSAAISALFPHEALVAAAVPFLADAGGELSAWLRRRGNVFFVLEKAANVDMFGELKRLFPHIRFVGEHLQHFLTNRNFGFPDEISLEKYVLSRRSNQDVVW
jgi:hypothetical protein